MCTNQGRPDTSSQTCVKEHSGADHAARDAGWVGSAGGRAGRGGTSRSR